MIREIKKGIDIPDRDAKTAANMAGGILGRALENLDIGPEENCLGNSQGSRIEQWEEMTTSVLRMKAERADTGRTGELKSWREPLREI